MAIKAILFDKDGTLIDVNGTWVPFYRAVLAEQFASAQVDELMCRAGYEPETGGFRAGSILAGGTTRQLVERWWPEASPAAVARKVNELDAGYRHLALKHLKPLMPLEPILARLRAQGYRLGVATNDTAASAASHLAELGVSGYFDHVLGADSVARPKPAGDMVVAFAAGLDLKPAEIAMVGDNPHDMETGRAGGAGLLVAVLSGNSAHDDIAHLADHVIPTIADLGALLEGL